MIEVGINIQPHVTSRLHRLVWWFRKKHYTVKLPESWQEVSEKTFWKLLAHHTRRAGISEYAFQLLLLRDLMGIPKWLYYLLPKDQIADSLLPKIQWAAILKFEELPVQQLQVCKKPWQLPAADASDLTVQQYFLLEEAFHTLFSVPKGRNQSAAEFLAALLRPVTPSFTDHYQRTGLMPTVSSVELLQYTKTLASATPEQQLYAVQAYAAIRLHLRDRYPKLFEIKTEKAAEEEIDWASIPPKIAEAGPFGILRDVLATPVISYLAWANARHEELEEQTDKPKNLQDIIRENHRKFLN